MNSIVTFSKTIAARTHAKAEHVPLNRREVAKEQRARLNTDESSAEREKLESDVMTWQDGPYGKAWAANIRDRPRPQQLISCIAASDQENVYARYVCS